MTSRATLSLRFKRFRRSIRAVTPGGRLAPDPGRPSPWQSQPHDPQFPIGTNDGLFATGTFASGLPIPVPDTKCLIAFATAGTTTTLTALGNDGKTTIQFPTFVTVGQPQRFTGSTFSSVKPSVGDANIAWFLIPDGPYAPFDSGVASALGNVQVISPGTEISSVVQNGHTYYIMPAAPGSEPTWNVNLGPASLSDATFIGMGPWGGVPAPVAGNVTLPAAWSAIRLITPATAANGHTFIRCRFQNLAFTSPITTAQASTITVSKGAFIWGSQSEGVVLDCVAGIDMGFAVTRATGEGMVANYYRHLTSFGGTTEATPGSGTTYTAGITGEASFSILCTSTGVAITITGPNGAATLVTAANAISGNTFTPATQVQKGGVYTITNGTFNAALTTTAATSPPFITPQFFTLYAPVFEFQPFSSITGFANQGICIGTSVSGADNNALTLGKIQIDFARVFTQDIYSTDAWVDDETPNATVGHNTVVRDSEYHNCKIAGTNFDRMAIIRTRQVYNLTGLTAEPFFRTYSTTVTQGFGTLFISDCEVIQTSALGTGDSTQAILVTGSNASGSTPFHADEVRIEGCLFILNGNATGASSVAVINIDPANAAAQPIDRVILKNLKYSYSGKTPGAVKPFAIIGYGGATGGAYTTESLEVDGILAFGASAANGSYPQTFGGAQTNEFISLNPDANTVTITAFGYRNFDATAITAPTAFILYGANTTVTNYKGVHSLYPNLDTLLTVSLASAPTTFTYTHGVTTGTGPTPQGPGFLVVTGGTTSVVNKNGLQFASTDAAAFSPSCEVDMGDTVAITYSANTVTIKVKGVNR